jgi:glycosyltransferase involved in cell wall biosynthesis
MSEPAAPTASATPPDGLPAGRPRDVFLVANAADELGGVAGWTHRMAGLFAERGHRVQVIGIAPVIPELRRELPPGLPYRVRTLYRAHPGVAWYPRRHAWSVARHPGRAATEVRRRAGRREAVRQLSELFRSAEPGGVVITTQVWAAEWVSRADTAGLLTIGMSHESFAATEASGRYARVRRYYAGMDRLLALTQQDADEWVRIGGMNHCGAMPNPLPFTPAAQAPRRAKVVAAIGRLSYEKGFDLLLESWARVAPKAPDWRLRIYGVGPEEAALRAASARLGIADSVSFEGRTDDVEGVLQQSSVLAQASRAEGFPMTLLEAMACGVPCVAFDCAPGVREIVTDGEDGLLATPGDVYTFADRLTALITDEGLRDRLGERAFGSVRRFAPAEIVDRWERLFALLER